MILGMTQAALPLSKATMAALDLDQSGEAPEWVHLLPTAKGKVQTQDQRGPYTVEDAEAIIAASFADQSKLQIDENHAEDLKSGHGEPSPARGWIVELQAREDGIWGRVEWTSAGRALVADKAYRAMSPVILHDKAKRVVAILRASLVNRPNLKGLQTLNQEKSMDLMAQMAAALGLSEGASADDILAAIKALKDKKPEGDAAMQSALSEIGVAFGLAADAKPEAVVAAANLARAGKEDLVALQSENAGLKTRIEALESGEKRRAAEAFIDKAITDRRAGVNAANRDAMIALHMSDKDTAEKLVNGMPMLTATGTVQTPPPAKDGVISLNAEQLEACRKVGISEEDFKKTLAEEAR
jgi:phage I-like protein